MNNQNMQTSVYAQKVDLLLRLLPLVMEEKVFAVHGGTSHIFHWQTARKV